MGSDARRQAEQVASLRDEVVRLTVALAHAEDKRQAAVTTAAAEAAALGEQLAAANTEIEA